MSSSRRGALRYGTLEFRASHRYCRTSARKAKYVADVVRGKQVHKAMAELRMIPRRASHYMHRLLSSAVSNVEDRLANDSSLDVEVDDLYVKEVRVGEGPTAKRWRPRSLGRVNQVLKRSCHLYVVLSTPLSAADEEGLEPRGGGDDAPELADHREDEN